MCFVEGARGERRGETKALVFSESCTSTDHYCCTRDARRYLFLLVCLCFVRHVVLGHKCGSMVVLLGVFAFVWLEYTCLVGSGIRRPS